jgi:hypothetical protein
MELESKIVEKKPRMVDSGTYYKDYYHKKNEFITCQCGAIIKRFYLLKHLKKPKHLASLEFNKNLQILESLGENLKT